MAPVDSKDDITHLLELARCGDAECQSRLMSAVYETLRHLAAGRLRLERRDHTLQPSALVNEAYLRLAGPETSWKNRTHFFAAAAGVMRKILVDYARTRSAQRRHGGKRMGLDHLHVASPLDFEEMILLDIALRELFTLNERHGRVVELHFFGGLSFEEIGDLLEVSSRTAKRDWEQARAWLQVQIKGVRYVAS